MMLATAAMAGDSFDWPQFRGPERDGVSPETEILNTWPEDGPRQLWRRQIGIGYSGVSVKGDRLYTMYTRTEGDAEIEVVAAFAAADGSELWHTPVGEAITSDWGNGPRSTPTVDGDSVFALGSLGKLVAVAAADGSTRWEVDLTERFGCQRPYHGFSASALVQGTTLVIESGATEGMAFAGLDTKTGETLWAVGDGRGGPAYNSALPIHMHGRDQILYQVRAGIVSLTRDGTLLWSHELPDGEAHAMPVFVSPDKVFVSGVEGVGAHLLQVDAGDDGAAVAITELWSNRNMKNHFSSSMHHEGHIYGFDNAVLKCIVAETGEVKWSKRGLGRGSLILADGHLIVLADKGRLLLLEATPSGYVEKGRVQALEGRSWTAPTLASGRLYVRNHSEIAAYDISSSAGGAS